MATDTLTPQTTPLPVSSEAQGSTPLDPRVKMQRNVEKLESSDFYKNLSPHKKVLVQTQFYNKFVKPAFKEGDSNLKTWLQGRAKKLNESDVTSSTEKAAMAVGHGAISLTKPLVKSVEALSEGMSGITKQKGDSVAKSFFDKIYSQDDKWMEQHYDDHLKDTAIKEVGTIVGQTPAMMAGAGFLRGIGLTELLGPGVASAPKIVQIGARMLHSAAEGYIFGEATGDDPGKSAMGFAVGNELFRPVEKFVGKLLGLGGQKLIKETTDSVVNAVREKAPEATNDVAHVVTGLAGTPKQKIHAATIQALNDLTGGDFVKSSPMAQTSAIAKLEKQAPGLAGELGFINQNIVEAKAAALTLKQRAMVPEFNQVLSDLEKIDGTPTPKTVAQSVADKAEKRQLVKVNQKKAPDNYLDQRLHPQQEREVTVPGAASSSSYEFEDNLSKRIGQGLDKLGLGKDKLVWEDRGHKLLFYLNLLLTDQRQLGASKERNKQFQFLMQHLNDRYKDATLPDLVKMSDNLWTHIEQLTKAGVTEEGKPTRIFRQTELRPGQSPFGHQVQLLRDAQTHEINERMDQDAFNKLKDKTVGKSGPGAAAATDPNFTGKKLGAHADLVNRITRGDPRLTGREIATYHDINGRQTIPSPQKNAIEQMLSAYKTDPIFKEVADASRHYVHNNGPMVDAAREAIGKEPIHDSLQKPHGNKMYDVYANKYWMTNTTMLDGHTEESNYVSKEKVTEMVESLHTAIRESQENGIPKYRGMTFSVYDPQQYKNLQIFKDLKSGDKIDLPLSSFSTDENVAHDFLTGYKNKENVVVKLDGNHKSMSMVPFNAHSESEHLTQGVFEVVDNKVIQGRQRIDSYREITIRQVGIF